MATDSVMVKHEISADAENEIQDTKEQVVTPTGSKEMFVEDKDSFSSSVDTAGQPSYSQQPKKTTSSESEEESEGPLPVFFTAEDSATLTVSRSYTDTQNGKNMKLTKTVHVCDVCSKAFTKPCHLKRHKLVHADQKEFVCDICSKTFTYIGNLNKHKLTHSDQKNFFCDVCNKAFICSENLKKHRLTHTGLKNHVCNLCGKAFGRPSHLRTHMLIHTDEKPLVCNVCQQAFRHYGPFKQHKLLHAP